jgi:predicted secreted protein
LTDIRSRRCVFVSHCILAQCVMAEGVVRHHPAIMRPVVEFCLANDINIIQMQCPETNCAAGGLGRRPRGKGWYERNGLRDTAASIASEQLDYMERLRAGGIEILAVIGVEFSPACAVTYLNKGRSIVRAEGIFIEELRNGMAKRGFQVAFVGVAAKWERRIERDLQALLVRRDGGLAETALHANP